MSVQHITVKAEDDGQRIDRWLQKHFPASSFILIRKTMRKGEIRVNKGRVQPGTKLSTGDEVRVPPQFTGMEKAERGQVSPKDIEFIRSLVIFEDNHVVVLNKPAGLATQGGTKTHRHVDALLDGLKKNKNDARPKLVHRLDKDTSGVLILAKTPEAARHLMNVFKGKDAQKTYIALTASVPIQKSGDIRAGLIKKGGKGYEKVVVDDAQGKSARTLYEVLDFAGKEAALIAFRPYSGRTHQIRVHSAEVLGAPIVGDGKYGYDSEVFEKLKLAKRMHLHAYEIKIPKFSEAGRGSWRVKAPLPKDFKESCKALGLETHIENPFDED